MDNLIINDNQLNVLYKTLSKNILYYRKKRDLSQLEVATSMGFKSVTFYSCAEGCRENKRFNLEHIYTIAEILNVDVYELLPSKISNFSNKELKV